ncbi:hypothetical protein PVAND_005516 [Polypedilum vanderplanki]|uniref:C2H2-type domain-containing protein n=1 Tax=Polypedilum vanderplanki TaxID=319348 RepID=A0A9J6C0F1_POLVA|nr:hypothetical protein PVAND_005516 [Polypedilum vanderplanki]
MDSIKKSSKADYSHQLDEVVAGNNKNLNLTNSSAHSSNSSSKLSKVNQSDIKDTNFEYEDKDNEWDIAIGDLIIDLDADIEKSSKTLQSPDKSVLKKDLKEKSKMSSVNNSNSSKNLSKLSMDHQATLDKGLKMKIKRTKTGKTSESKHEIVKNESNGSVNIDDQNCEKPCSLIVSSSPSSSSSSSGKRANNSHRKDKVKERVHSKDKQELKQEISSGDLNISNSAKKVDSHDRLNNSVTGGNVDSRKSIEHVSVGDLKRESLKTGSNMPGSGIYHNVDIKEDSKGSNSPPMKRVKCDSKNMVDVCVGTSVGTITEPDCLGPCEPGTSVTLEGIVWHETEGGVLAVNVTWRGKTYVGTLIDCTKHDWAPPRFCDSPTEDIESRMQKSGRSKRARNSTTSNHELINFTETRSSVHSKLRNGGTKGRTSRTSVNSSATSVTPSTSPTAFLVPKSDKRRKSKDESPANGSAVLANANSNLAGTATGINNANLKKPKNTTSPCAISPVLLECPEQDCSKKYKHANGLKYHQSHAHGSITNMDDEGRSMSPEPQSPNPNIQCSNSNQSAEKVATENSASETAPSPNVKAISIKSVMQLNEVQIKPFNTSPMNDDIKATKSNDDSFFDSSSVKAQSDASDSNLDKNKKSSIQFGLNPDFEQISNDSISEPMTQSTNMNFFQLNTDNNKVPSAKTKKNAKSPTHEENVEEQHTNAAPENVQSPAYSDISDDSNAAPIESHSLVGKPKSTGIEKIVSEQQANSNLIIGGYNNLSFYQSPSFLQNPDNQNNKPLIQTNLMNFEYGKPREQQPQQQQPHSALELMGKMHMTKPTPDIPTSSALPPGKMMHQHQQFPYNLVQGNYPYNMESPFKFNPAAVGPSGLSNEDLKGPMVKGEPVNDTILPNKSIKTEGIKDIRIDPSLEHPSFYSNLYGRHPLGLSREEDHRRLSINPPQIIKEEHMPPTSQMSNFQTSNQQQQQQQQHQAHKHSHKGSLSKNNFPKDMIKVGEKDSKLKQQQQQHQEGQKPTTETQGPPPPPTNQQFYLPYLGHGSPFFGDPLYRNMLVPPPFNTPYHLQISRFPSPEDLSRNTKALDLLQQHASQYYSTHKIHELGDQVNHLRNPAGSAKMAMPPDIPSLGNNINSSNNNGNSNVNNEKSSLKSNEIGKNLNDDKDEGSLRKLKELSGIDKDDGGKDKDDQPIKSKISIDDHRHHGDDDNINDVHSDEKSSKENNDKDDDDDGSSSSNEKSEKLCISNNDKDSSNSSFPSNHIIPNSTQLEGLGKIPSDRHEIDRISASPPSQRHSHHHRIGVYQMPMPVYSAPYVNSAGVLTSQQQQQVDVMNHPIDPFATASHK